MTTYHRHCASSPDKRCPNSPECSGPCHFDNAEISDKREGGNVWYTADEPELLEAVLLLLTVVALGVFAYGIVVYFGGL